MTGGLLASGSTFPSGGEGSSESMESESARPRFDLSEKPGVDSFSIVFENSESQKSEDGKSIDPHSVASSLGSDGAEALVWDRKKQQEKEESSKEKVFLYIVMQICQKESLKDWLRSCTVERNRRRSLLMFNEICLGVDYVHSKGLIHRDLKPGNIFFDQSGTIKIGDFGLVTDSGCADDNASSENEDTGNATLKARHNSHQHTAQVGTELYMSPEQVRRRPYNHKVDVYSLGLILFELLVPFSTQMERIKVLSDLREKKFPSHFLSREEFPVLSKMLSHDPDERPETHQVQETAFMREIASSEVPGESGDGGRKRTKSSISECSGTSGGDN